MDHITIVNEQSEEMVVNIGDLRRRFSQLSDRRGQQGKIYPLWYLLTVICLAKLSGEHTPTGISEWIRLRYPALREALAVHWRPAPSLNTIRRTLAESVLAAEVAEACRQFLHEHYGGQQTGSIAIDGKTMRGTIATGSTQGVHILSAYLPEEGVTLAQEAVAHHENELVAAPKLLAQLELRGKVVTGDAMFTQRELSVQVTAQGGDYLWFVKENQPTLFEDVQRFFAVPETRPGWSRPPLPQSKATQWNKAHGRLEQRTLTAVVDETAYLDWPAVAQVLKIERHTQVLRTGVWRHETAYAITSLTPEQASSQRLLELTRQHWGIENGLHYRRDVTLREDHTRISHRQQAQVMAVLNNFVVGLARKLGFHNLASAQRRFDAAISFHLGNYL
jgi:predicted transposase YbfD/YdcC